MFKSNKAFTLAEVLITLGIIGIVAEITIPSLYNSFQEQNYKVSYKKAYSVVSQALLRAQADYALKSPTGYYDTQILDNFKTIMSYIKTQKTCYDGVNNSGCWYRPGETFNSTSYGNGWPALYDLAVVDASGMDWASYAQGFSATVFVDTNGFKSPNQFGKDRFVFNFFDQNNSTISGLPVKVLPVGDNDYYACLSNKCASQSNYYGTSWLYN